MSGRTEEVIRGVEGVLPGESATARAAHESLKGNRRGIRRILPFLGPAFIAAVAYVDPGNFATNIAGGAQFGYLLLWVILTSNLMAMLIQSMSAKLGIATGKNLPEVCRARFPRPVTFLLWIQAEIIAMATDLAEFIGAALALNLLFGIPLFPAGLLTAVGAFGILELQRRGFRALGGVIIAMAIAGAINASMLIMAAALFHSAGLTGVGDIDKAFEQLRILEGSTPAILFGVALLASGLSSSSVGTLSGQVVMQGFINRQIPLFLRRLVTMLPALVVLAVGLNPSRALVISQVVLSFGIPFALIPLLIFCRNRNVMGTLVNHRLTTTIATVVVTLIVSLNVFLLYQTFFSA